MSGSWGHTIQLLEGDDRFERYRIGGELHTEPIPCSVCRAADKRPAAWLATYRYVAGRTAWARRYLCDGHAARFRWRWQPAEVAGAAPRHTLEQLVSPSEKR